MASRRWTKISLRTAPFTARTPACCSRHPTQRSRSGVFCSVALVWAVPGGGSDCKCVVQDTQPCAAAEVCFVCVRSVWQCACWQHLPACCSRHPILSGAGFCVVSLLYSHRAAPAAEFKQVRQVFTPIQQEHATLKQHTHTHTPGAPRTSPTWAASAGRSSRHLALTVRWRSAQAA